MNTLRCYCLLLASISLVACSSGKKLVPGAWVSVGFIIAVAGFVCSVSELKAENAILVKIGLGVGSAFLIGLIISFLHLGFVVKEKGRLKFLETAFF